ncbi:FAD-dependent oxidoreductase [Streptomyces sp. NPDC015131]|uniref:FAD-dependent oxidoreductase n=1 Tax=Streptomyces sp. NPDC015131 TaxID=3364941 RepID=UPI0036FD3A35
MSEVLVIGHGTAAHRFVERLRHHGHPGGVTVLTAGPGPAYHRPLLTAVLAGTLPAGAAVLPAPPDGVRVRTGTLAVRLDRRRRLVRAVGGFRTAGGGRRPEVYGYDHLVLATGARPVLPDVPGLRGPDGRLAEGVTTLRTPAEAERVAGGPVVVLGGGAAGVETALALRRAGHPVTLVHAQPLLMHRHLDGPAAEMLAGLLAARGVELRTGRRGTEYKPGRLVLDDGEVLRAGTLVVRTGTAPATALARTAGLPVRHGVLVDDRLTTADPRVHAIGGCAEPGGEAPGGGVTSAWAQAEVLADRLTGGRSRHPGTPFVLRPAAGDIDLLRLGAPGATRTHDAVTPAGPADPTGSTSPTGPADPTGSTDPTSPAGPADPTGSTSPTGPADPAGSTSPAGPAGLTTPTTPTAPAGTRTVRLSDPARGRYARVALRPDGRVAEAVLLGLPRAGAVLTQLHDHGRPVPADLLGLLLGTPTPAREDGDGQPDDAPVCLCNGVTRRALERAWHDGARTTGDLARVTRATTGCGGCAPDVRALCATLAAAPRTGEDAP